MNQSKRIAVNAMITGNAIAVTAIGMAISQNNDSFCSDMRVPTGFFISNREEYGGHEEFANFLLRDLRVLRG
jgi:hypothetical protein